LACSRECGDEPSGSGATELVSSNIKSSKVWPPAMAKMMSNEISRIMPGMKDHISVNSNGKKVQLQK
jgi:hypothetical protein